MQTNPESSAVEAVAWIDMAKLSGHGMVYATPFKCSDRQSPLYPQSALDALRGEVERLRSQVSYEFSERELATIQRDDAWEREAAHKQRADAAERRVAELGALLRAWHAEESRYGVSGQAPGHSHQVPGVWDSDNGPIAGTACAKCALWAQIREIARSESP